MASYRRQNRIQEGEVIMSELKMGDAFELPVTKEREVCILEDRTP